MPYVVVVRKVEIGADKTKKVNEIEFLFGLDEEEKVFDFVKTALNSEHTVTIDKI